MFLSSLFLLSGCQKDVNTNTPYEIVADKRIENYGGETHVVVLAPESATIEDFRSWFNEIKKNDSSSLPLDVSFYHKERRTFNPRDLLAQAKESNNYLWVRQHTNLKGVPLKP